MGGKSAAQGFVFFFLVEWEKLTSVHALAFDGKSCASKRTNNHQNNNKAKVKIMKPEYLLKIKRIRM